MNKNEIIAWLESLESEALVWIEDDMLFTGEPSKRGEHGAIVIDALKVGLEPVED